MSEIYGNAILSDNSRITSQTGVSGFGYDIGYSDVENVPGFVIADSTISGTTDNTYFQGAVLGSNDLTLTLSNWVYVGGTVSDMTWSGGTWMTRWYDPLWVYYSIWHENYDTLAFSIIGYKFRDPTRQNVGQYYASMVVPDPDGHYQIRWVYEKDSTSYAHEIVTPFVGLSRGIDAMPDYPLSQPPADSTGAHEDPEGNDTQGAIIIPGDLSQDSLDLSEGGSYG
jgi:hypothetical protein